MGIELMDDNGEIWIPCNGTVDTMIEASRGALERVYLIEYVADPRANPLYLATDDVRDLLMRYPDKLVNENQIATLNTNTPFIVLKTKLQQAVASAKFDSGTISPKKRKAPY